MTLSTQVLKAWLKAAYDKAVLFLALAGLLLSLIFLILKVEGEHKKMEDLGRRQEQSRVLSQTARQLDLTSLDEGIEALQGAARVPAWQKHLMVAELRVGCVKCGRPIPPDSGVCPFLNCGAQQPLAPVQGEKDSDLDGMSDKWELKYGLNPNVDDASQDVDGDGFTNLEEFQASTHPREADDHPPYAQKLRVIKTGRAPMPLSFQGVQNLSTNDVLFLLRNKVKQRDTYARLGDTVDGYKLVKFEEKHAKVRRGNLELDEDVSVLTLSRGNKLFPLTINRENQGEPAASLLFLVDQTRLLAKQGEVITLKNSSYKIVDIKKDSVIVADVNTGMEIPVQPLSEADKQFLPKLGTAKPDSLPDLKP
ncbi:MAG: hypothetical protein HYV36_07830 [Lentisphaerae bacterium]|nr:hypothetical protein [Lentisphaerota bacterium]